MDARLGGHLPHRDEVTHHQSKRPDHPPTFHGGRVIEAEPSQETQPVTDTTAAIPVPATVRRLLPQSVSASLSRSTCTVDGVSADVEWYGRSVGCGACDEHELAVHAFRNVRLTDREAWDDAHEGVEPTAEAMSAALAEAEEEVALEAVQEDY